MALRLFVGRGGAGCGPVDASEMEVDEAPVEGAGFATCLLKWIGPVPGLEGRPGMMMRSGYSSEAAYRCAVTALPCGTRDS
jgi:hypothetical protein